MLTCQMLGACWGPHPRLLFVSSRPTDEDTHIQSPRTPAASAKQSPEIAHFGLVLPRAQASGRQYGRGTMSDLGVGRPHRIARRPPPCVNMDSYHWHLMCKVRVQGVILLGVRGVDLSFCFRAKLPRPKGTDTPFDDGLMGWISLSDDCGKPWEN